MFAKEVYMTTNNSYANLIDLFQEFREFLKPKLVEGVPDYTPSFMEEKHRELKKYQECLASIDPSGWPVPQQVDYHVVRAEMNGVDFDHRVLRPWARDPGFYNIIDGIYPRLIVHYTRMLSDWPLTVPKFPLKNSEIPKFKMKLQAIPKLFAQAKENLSEASGELATIAIRVKEKEIDFLKRIISGLTQYHPHLVQIAQQALEAVKDFRNWLQVNKSKMNAPAGIGKDNYNWWLRNVQLIPYTWDECLAIIQSEYNRALAFLKLEEHKNRKLPPFKITSSEEENLMRQKEAAEALFRFLREEEVISIPSFLKPLPAQYYPRVWGVSAYLNPNEYDFFEQCCDREPMTQIAHTFFGHYYTKGRTIWYQDGDNRPIRGVIRLFDIHEARSEALSFAVEEMLMQLGWLDSHPRAREITYIWMIFRAARAIVDLKMHSHDYSMQEGIKKIVEMLPYPWAKEDSDSVWWDVEETLRAPGHVTFYVIGKNMIWQLIKDRALQLKDKFSLRQFMDEFMRGGIIPISLTRWEMTGLEDEIKKLW